MAMAMAMAMAISAAAEGAAAAMASAVLSPRFLHFSFSPPSPSSSSLSSPSPSSSSSSSSSSVCAFRLPPRQIHPASPLRRSGGSRTRTNAASADGSETKRGDEEEGEEGAEDEEEDGTNGDDAGFEERLAKLQRRRSGKKAEKRKALKANPSYASSSSTAAGKGNVFLPPVPLRDPISDGLPVELGFNSYTERINGRFAALGLAAVLLIELSTGESFLKYHDSSILTVQIYFLLSCSALFIKYEKEKISIWPKS